MLGGGGTLADMYELLTTEELAALAKKVKDGSATNEEIINYLDTVNGLLGEFLAAMKSMPTDEEIAKK